jgi:serine/threonine-protein kinase
MQGYLLINAQGNRIDEGPIEIVGDALKTAGTAAIVNGLSCMACHQNGMIRFKDTVRSGQALAGQAREKVELLYRDPDEMGRLLARDEARFLKAMDASCGKFLKHGDDRDKSIREFPEPVGAIARLYLKDLELDDVAAELGRRPDALKVTLENNPALQQIGLGPLIRKASIKRTEWDSLNGRTRSTYQRVASELRMGIPYRVLSSRPTDQH